MKKLIKKKWLAALRSGEYEQAKGVLHNSDGHCCLGVLCEVAGLKNVVGGVYADESGTVLGEVDLTEEGLEFFGLTEDQQEKLIEMNDGKSRSFKHIASYIERYVD